MLHKLRPAQYPQITPLFSALDYNLVIRSVVEGNTPAWVYVDNVDAPTAALMWDRQDAMLLAGTPESSALNSDIRGILIDQILPDARERWVPELTLCYTPAHWSDVIEQILPGFEAVLVSRSSYRLESLKIDWRSCLPEEFSLRPIDSELLSSDLSNIDDVRGWIDSFWHTPTDFLRKGFGFCAVHEDSIASWSLTVFAAGSERELGLATDSRYRKRGLATISAAACVEHCLTNGLTPHWHCAADNIPSHRVAEKIGFRKERDYSVYQFSI
jgi:GNAT superfamily N-acetyltransferase